MKIIPSECRFMIAAEQTRLFPEDFACEFAFWGGSNVGKSTLLNSLMGRTHLARTSKTPGRTQAVNFYFVAPGLRFVDLPGYGYAKVPAQIQKKWDHLISSYLTERPLRIFLLLDARHAPKALDVTVVNFLYERKCSFECVLTKCDKVSALKVQELKEHLGKKFQCVVWETSSKEKRGIEILKSEILNSFNLFHSGDQETCL
jgi:GTP-binding protein